MNKMGSTIGFEMSLIIVEAIRGRCASFMSLPATVSEIFDIWWTDNPIYFSRIVVNSAMYRVAPEGPT